MTVVGHNKCAPRHLIQCSIHFKVQPWFTIEQGFSRHVFNVFNLCAWTTVERDRGRDHTFGPGMMGYPPLTGVAAQASSV